jgi:ankyrin repeat protein
MKMVRHLMENYNVDPTVRDGLGRNALEMAAMHSDNTEVLNLLLRHTNVEIDGCDDYGTTALHFAAHSSNVVTARHLIKMGATPNLFTHTYGLSPLHSAAHYSDDTEMTEMINLL